MHDLKEYLPDKLKKLRKARGLTIKEVAEATKMTSAALSAYENGVKIPQLDFAIRLADFYETSLDVICGLPERQKPDVTRADCMRALLTLIENMNCEISVEEDIIYGDEAPEHDKTNDNWAILKIQGTWVMRFCRTFKSLSGMLKSKDLYPEDVTLWTSKQLNDAENQQP